MAHLTRAACWGYLQRSQMVHGSTRMQHQMDDVPLNGFRTGQQVGSLQFWPAFSSRGMFVQIKHSNYFEASDGECNFYWSHWYPSLIYVYIYHWSLDVYYTACLDQNWKGVECAVGQSKMAPHRFTSWQRTLVEHVAPCLGNARHFYFCLGLLAWYSSNYYHIYFCLEKDDWACVTGLHGL